MKMSPDATPRGENRVIRRQLIQQVQGLGRREKGKKGDGGGEWEPKMRT